MTRGLTHQLRPIATSSRKAHSASVMKRESSVTCHQVSGLLMMVSTIHHPMSPTPSIGAISLQGTHIRRYYNYSSVAIIGRTVASMM